MDNREREIQEQIRKKMEQTEVPDSLKPEHIEMRLRGRKQKGWKRSYTYGLAMACCVVLVGAAVLAMAGNSIFNRNAGQSPTAGSAEADTGKTTISTAQNYKEIYDILDETRKEQERASSGGLFGFGVAKYGMSMESVEDSAAEATTGSGDMGAGSGGYSETNVRQEGVDEGDNVKTDGNYLYVIKDSAMEIAVVDARDDRMREVATVKMEDAEQITEIYLKDNKLIVICESGYSVGEDGAYRQFVKAITYDVEHAETPKKLGEVSQSGYYMTSRIVGNYLYLFSNFWADYEFKKNTPAGYIPSVDGKMLAEDSIYLPPEDRADIYTVISSVDLNEPDRTVDGKAILSEGGCTYVSNENIYIYQEDWSGDKGYNTTIIRKISYKDGVLKAKTCGEIKGSINDSFSIDEYQGYLRVVTTVNPIRKEARPWYAKFTTWSSARDAEEVDTEEAATAETEMTNSVYVLNEDMEVVGKIEGLAEDERIYSARFMGDVGYFVTFRETDPLFSVDLSNPTDPKIIGQLKIPGFSQYLHGYGEGKLLGIGMEATDDGMTTGVKLSMFDISDPKNVSEIQKFVLEQSYSTDVFYDYKAALIDVEKNWIGFSTYQGESEVYHVFSYSPEKGFEETMSAGISNMTYQSTRGLYIGHTLYVCKGEVIESYDLENGEKIDDIVL